MGAKQRVQRSKPPGEIRKRQEKNGAVEGGGKQGVKSANKIPKMKQKKKKKK